MKWLLTAVLLFILAAALDLSLLVYAIYAIALILVVSRVVTRNWAANVTSQRKSSATTANVGDQVTVKMEITNQSAWPITWMIIEDLIPRKSLSQHSPALEISGKRIDICKFRGRETKRWMYQIRCHRRGYHQIGPTLVETGDMFGFNRKFRVLNEPQFLLVYPEIVPLAGYDIDSKRPIGEVIMTNRLFEDPTRIAGVRDYQSGDPLNRIHWRATASTGTLQSKLYEPSSLAGATLVVDFHQDSFEQRDEPVRSELSITTAASLANALHEMGQQCGLISNGRDAVDRIRREGWQGDERTRGQAESSARMAAHSERIQPVMVPTRKGPIQHLQILRSLARLELTDALTFPQLLMEAHSRLSRSATVVAILSSMNLEKAVALQALKKQGFRVTAIVNQFSDEVFARTSSALLEQGIPVSQLKDQESIRGICEKTALLK
ncbi:MAG: DUF58 domain-containing protein [Mariniblastus sp.]|nr:DUF58 domain-containing protein [Mariniblastus sp.]